LSQQSQPSSRRGASAAAFIGLVIIAILSLAFAGYTSLNPHTATVTQQQLVTNTESIYNTQTVTTLSTVTPVATTSMPTASATTTASTVSVSAATTASVVYVTPGPYNGCGASGCFSPGLGAYGTMCQSTTQNGTVQCSGYLYNLSGGCEKLAIPYINPDVLETTAYVYYTLQNLPPNSPPTGSWVTVTGQLYQLPSFWSNGETCSGSYIQVTSIS